MRNYTRLFFCILFHMRKHWYTPFLPHALAIGIFLVVSFLVCRPAFEHRTLNQYDNDQWKAMSHNSFQYQETHGHFPLWTEGMFSGMPGYQIAMEAPAISPQYQLYNILTLGLPKPAAFFFLGCICFYILAMALRVNPYAAIIGALAYAYSTYNPTALVVGHETKIQAIQIMPAFLAGLLLIYEKRYWLGVAATALFTALFIAANHPQINYYGGIIAAFMTGAYVIRWIRSRQYRHMAISAGLTIAGAVIGLACNAVVTLTTLDYAKASLRDGSALATAGGSVTRTGLSEAYALSYSMYKTEAFELLVPKIYGGGGPLNAMISQDDSKAIAALQNLPPQTASFLQQFLDFYWGGISDSTGGPAYAGAVICLLALMGFFVLDSKHKWWILAVSILAIFMSWGSYFVDFNGFLLKVLPGYNKFRAPSLAIVIPNFLFCWLAILVLDKLLKLTPAARLQTWQQYAEGLYLTGGIFAVLLICYLSFDYVGQYDGRLTRIAGSQPPQVQQLIHTFQHELRADRQAIFFGSIVRSFLFILGAALVGVAWIKSRIKPLLALGLIGGLAVIDILTLDALYMNSDNYRDIGEAQTPFTPTAADRQIMKDTSYYRVFDLRQGAGRAITNYATAAWFHRTVAGYHPAKLSIYEDLLENQLEKFPDCQPTVNMLNTKYLLLPTADGRGDSAVLNPDALGAAWFVSGLRSDPTPRALMDDLTHLDTRDTALVFSGDAAAKNIQNIPAPGDTIYLTDNGNDEMTYRSISKNPRFAVFSEVYYDRGWHALIDHRIEAPIIRTNYVLRGLAIPAGEHTISFIFHPASYYTGRVIQIAASILLLLLLIIAAFREWRTAGIDKNLAPKGNHPTAGEQ